jgi:serine/threonine-protein kinase
VAVILSAVPMAAVSATSSNVSVFLEPSLEFFQVEEFYDGIATVTINESDLRGQRSFINARGEIIETLEIGFEYDYLTDFRNGMAAIRTKHLDDNGFFYHKYGFINMRGEVVIPIQFDDLLIHECAYCIYADFSSGLAAVNRGGWGDEWGFINTSGELVIPFQFAAVGNFSEGLAAFGIETGNTDEWGRPILKWGFIDTNGTIKIPAVYDDVQDFSEGLAAVNYGGQLSFINTGGEIAFNVEYDTVRSFSGGLAAVAVGATNQWVGGQWGFIDTMGNLAIPIQYSQVMDFNNGLAAVGDDEWRWGFINTSGNLVVPMIYTTKNSGIPFLAGDLAVVVVRDDEDWQFGVINRNGEVVLPFEYDWAYVPLPRNSRESA